MDKLPTQQMPAATIDTMARTVYEQASEYGFTRLDHIRLVSALLSMDDESQPTRQHADVAVGAGYTKAKGDEKPRTHLPITSNRLSIALLENSEQCHILEHWLRGSFGHFFLSGCASAQAHVLQEMLAQPLNQFGLVSLHEGQPIGAVAYLDIDDQNQRAEFRIIIAEPSARRQALGAEAAQAWLEYGFEGLSLEKIFVQTLEGEIHSARMIECLGFEFEGLLKSEIRSGSARYHVSRWGMTRQSRLLIDYKG